MSTLVPDGGWAVQQLAGLLAGISNYPDEPSMLAGAIHRITEAVDAEVGAVVDEAGVAFVVGFPAEDIPHDDLSSVALHGSGKVDVDGLGTITIEVIELALDRPACLLVGRSGERLTQGEVHLVRAMAQVLTLALQLRRTADRERDLRLRSEKQAEALHQTNVQLRRAAAMKQDLISMTSHELRTPLTSILGFTDVLRERWDQIDADSRRTYLDVVSRHGNRLLQLVDDLLTMGRLDSGRVEPSPTVIAVQDAIADLLALHGHDIEITGDPDALAVADAGHLDQMVLNLVTNAVKYGAPPIRIELSTPTPDVTSIAISDAGPGVAQEFVPNLFERFSQASRGDSRNGTGTGLGLAIVRGLCDLNRGSVGYERRDGRTYFTLSLPTSRTW